MAMRHDVSPLRRACVLAQAGYDVIWICRRAAIGALVDELVSAGAEVSRCRGREGARWPSGGRVFLKSTDMKSCRGVSADALFVPSDMVSSDAMVSVMPSVAASRLEGRGAPVFSTY